VHIVQVLCADYCPGMFRWMEKWCRTVLRSVWLSSDVGMMYSIVCPMVGGVGCTRLLSSRRAPQSHSGEILTTTRVRDQMAEETRGDQ